MIVANGPSLNHMDHSYIRNETIIGLNKIYLGTERFGFYPRYLVAVNEKVLRQSAADLARMNCIKFIGEKGAQWIPEDPLTYHVMTNSSPQRFCEDIESGVNEGGTVTYVALQIAYYLGFTEIVLVGLDHRFTYTGAPNEARRLEGPDPNHFSSEYFSNQDWDNPDLERSEQSYKIARRIFEADNRRITDATMNGACSIFEKRDYRDVLSR